jgi:hypothetical protein
MHELHSWPHMSQVLYYFVRKFVAIFALQYEWYTEHTKDVRYLIGQFLGGFDLQGTKNCEFGQMAFIVPNESVISIWFRLHINQVSWHREFIYNERTGSTTNPRFDFFFLS